MSRIIKIIIFFGYLLFVSSAVANEKPLNAAIASAHPLATAAGIEILKAGGNAFDAAVAVAATLSVVEPSGSGLGGGGFWLLHRESDKYDVMIDARETAPQKARRDMYLDKNGDIVPLASIAGPLAAAIPGLPASLIHIAQRYGRLPLKVTMAPAIRIAKEGFEVDDRYLHFTKLRLKALRASTAAASIFLYKNDVPPKGFVLKQPDLANTLHDISESGLDGFYRGEFAKKLVQGVNNSGGIWSVADLDTYKVIERQPVVGNYGDLKLISVAPPSAGGVALISMLNMLSQFEYQKLNKLQRAHLLIEIMRRAYRDRAEFLGDPDFFQVPQEMLTSIDYAKQLVKNIKLDEATASYALRAANSSMGAGDNTTHFSVLDRDGNRVAATLSINYPFGACFVVPGTGFLLNDEMDDFSAKPGSPNAYGLVGAQANAIAPGKRPLSSMSPTFLEDKKAVVMLGTPGGSRIISMVLIGALKYLDGGSAQEIVAQPRFHHQYLPDVVMYEDKAFTNEEIEELSLLGHIMKRQMSPYGDGQSIYGNMQVIVWDKQHNKVSAASDPRGIGSAQLF